MGVTRAQCNADTMHTRGEALNIDTTGAAEGPLTPCRLDSRACPLFSFWRSTGGMRCGRHVASARFLSGGRNTKAHGWADTFLRANRTTSTNRMATAYSQVVRPLPQCALPAPGPWTIKDMAFSPLDTSLGKYLPN